MTKSLRLSIEFLESKDTTTNKKMAKREDNLETRFIQLCKLNGFRTIKVNPKQYDGFPDRIVFNTDIGEISAAAKRH